jgi:nitroimidazol reductase NimA-like FMN-containing flavoprotein (pyridoxamine 5'-phosphate oxidase superfamily)
MDKLLSRGTLIYMTPEDKIFNDLTAMDQSVGVIGTMGGYGQPQVASLYFISDSALNIYFIARESSRKYKNIKRNPRVAFVVSSENPPQTVQIEGEAQEVSDPHEENEYFTKLVALASEKNVIPPVSQMEDGRMVFMKIVTDWARSGNFETLKEGDRFVEAALL